MGFSTRRSSSLGSAEKRDKRALANKDDEGFVSSGPVEDVEQNAVPGTAELVDGVFGAQTAEGPNYRSVGWVSTSILLMKVRFSVSRLVSLS